MKNNKYIITDVSKEVFGVKVFQIKALISFGSVSKGDLGGYIEKEGNLSVSGNAWVYGDACVYGNACVYGDARVYGAIKILAGLFFGNRNDSEEIKYQKIEGVNTELIYKGEAKFGEEEKDLSGKEVEVVVDGKTYKAIIK